MYKKTAMAILTVLWMTMMMFLSSCGESQMVSQKSCRTEDAHKGWRLGIQAWSFNRYSLYEAIDKTASLGLCYIEAYPGQKVSKEKPDVAFGPDTSAEIRKEVKQKLAEAGVKLVNFGVVDLKNDEAQCRKVFDFAEDMGIETIVSEPPEDAFDIIDRLCREYKIKVAIHNHPKAPTSHYWHPDAVLKVCKGRSKWIGACADTGHWPRSGVDPVEAIKKLQGRIISLHFKDIATLGDPETEDVVWGAGKANVKAMLKELDRQGFKGVFSIEYERNWEKSIPEIQQCIEYFNKTASQL